MDNFEYGNLINSAQCVCVFTKCGHRLNGFVENYTFLIAKIIQWLIDFSDQLLSNCTHRHKDRRRRDTQLRAFRIYSIYTFHGMIAKLTSEHMNMK